jgi:hypothetical protein
MRIGTPGARRATKNAGPEAGAALRNYKATGRPQ